MKSAIAKGSTFTIDLPEIEVASGVRQLVDFDISALLLSPPAYC